MQCFFVQARRKLPLPKMGGRLVKQICPLMKGVCFCGDWFLLKNYAYFSSV